MKITLEFLKEKNACKEAIDMFAQNNSYNGKIEIVDILNELIKLFKVFQN